MIEHGVWQGAWEAYFVTHQAEKMVSIGPCWVGPSLSLNVTYKIPLLSSTKSLTSQVSLAQLMEWNKEKSSLITPMPSISKPNFTAAPIPADGVSSLPPVYGLCCTTVASIYSSSCAMIMFLYRWAIHLVNTETWSSKHWQEHYISFTAYWANLMVAAKEAVSCTVMRVTSQSPLPHTPHWPHLLTPWNQ